ncbi:MAG: MbnP family protein [Flavobacteriales bacterium]
MPYLFLFLFALTGQLYFAQQQIDINWNGLIFELDNTYQLNDSTALRISQFKFYVQADPKKGGQAIYLVDAAERSSWQWETQHEELQIGVSTALQTSGVFIGALDPINGMYWAWNTGFIAVKCVGEILELKNSHTQKFEYHLGAYQAPFACITTLGGSGTTLSCDLQAWFSSILATEITEWNIMQPSKASKVLFDLFVSSLSYAK